MGFEIVDEYAVRLISVRARQLVGKAGITESDCEDIEQELTLHLLQQSESYDPQRASVHTFVACVIENKVGDILDHRRAARRDRSRTEFSLNDTVRDEEGGETELAATIPAEADPPEKLRDLAIDLAELLPQLPASLRVLCERLKTRGISEVARETGLPRWTIYESLKKLRRRLRKGFSDYF